MSGRGVVLVAALAVLTGAVVGTPRLLRRMSFFRVRQVQLLGVRYLAQDSVLAALRLRPDQNVFDDTAALERRVAAMAGVVSARVDRRLPATLKVTVVERLPVAFAVGPDRLVPLDEEGRPLPYDPAATGLDLPVISRADSLLVRTLSVLRLADSTLFQDVDGARRGARGGVALELGPRQVLLAGVPTAEEVVAIGAVRRHLAASGRRYAELDARFDGWVVVRRSPT